MARHRKISFEFNPFEETGATLPEGADKQQVLSDIADLVLEETISFMDNRQSPVQGHGSFPRLSKDYAKKKKAAGLPAVPNLEFEGDLKAAISASYKGNRVKISVDGGQSGKADGHCNFSGDSPLPMRRFIPNAEEDETFKRQILSKVRDLIEEG